MEKLCGGRFLCEALGFITLAFIILLFVCFGLAMPIQFILEFDLVVCRCKYNNPSVSVGVLVWVCNRNNQSNYAFGDCYNVTGRIWDSVIGWLTL